jgi:hypothetical protein
METKTYTPEQIEEIHRQAAQRWREMEETTTRHQLEAIRSAPRHTPLNPPYRPRDPDIESPPLAPEE